MSVKEIILFPITSIYNYTIKIHEKYRIDNELAIIMKLELILLSLALVIKMKYLIFLLLGNFLNIPLILYLGGKEDLFRVVRSKSSAKYHTSIEEEDGIVRIGADNNLSLEENKVLHKQYFNENASILNKIASILRFATIDGLKKVAPKPKGVLKKGLIRLFKEDDIEYIKPDLYDEETGEVEVDVDDIPQSSDIHGESEDDEDEQYLNDDPTDTGEYVDGGFSNIVASYDESEDIEKYSTTDDEMNNYNHISIDGADNSNVMYGSDDEDYEDDEEDYEFEYDDEESVESLINSTTSPEVFDNILSNVKRGAMKDDRQ